MNNQNPILYVEDEDTDALLMRLALQRAGVQHPLKIATDGAQALDYLAGRGNYVDRNQHPSPALILLDLNLPRKSGFELLGWIRRQPAYASLPVVVYTSSTQESDRAKASELGASDYVVKKSDVNEIAAFARTLSTRWLSTVPLF